MSILAVVAPAFVTNRIVGASAQVERSAQLTPPTSGYFPSDKKLSTGITHQARHLSNVAGVTFSPGQLSCKKEKQDHC